MNHKTTRYILGILMIILSLAFYISGSFSLGTPSPSYVLYLWLSIIFPLATGITYFYLGKKMISNISTHLSLIAGIFSLSLIIIFLAFTFFLPHGYGGPSERTIIILVFLSNLISLVSGIVGIIKGRKTVTNSMN